MTDFFTTVAGIQVQGFDVAEGSYSPRRLCVSLALRQERTPGQDMQTSTSIIFSPLVAKQLAAALLQAAAAFDAEAQDV